eukprot:1796302-Amphidinium_carterae.1
MLGEASKYCHDIRFWESCGNVVADRCFACLRLLACCSSITELTHRPMLSIEAKGEEGCQSQTRSCVELMSLVTFTASQVTFAARQKVTIAWIRSQ